MPRKSVMVFTPHGSGRRRWWCFERDGLPIGTFNWAELHQLMVAAREAIQDDVRKKVEPKGGES